MEVLLPSSDVLFEKVDGTASFEVFDPKIVEEDDDTEESYAAEQLQIGTPEESSEPEQLQIAVSEKTDASGGKAAFLAQYSGKIKRQNQILLYNAATNPLTAVKNIDKKAREFIEETGVNVAYMAFGFVHWKESAASNYVFRAPILLVPIQLEQASAVEPYFIKSAEDDIIVNPTFSYKMDAEHGVKLPEYNDEGLIVYLEKVKRLVAKLQWTVTAECKIGIFSFLKINMYRDLKDNAKAILANQNVRQLLGEPTSTEKLYGDEGTAGSVIDPLIELHSVVDADSSQIEAIEMAKSGKSFVLQGPPGTGKTSIARSVAEAMNKKYVRICLGGVRDEAEIRGHRKTYVAAMPGRITVALKEAGVSNPLMLLDEIDKTSSDYKGDTSAALLEVLDPEQNSKFNDHYVEIPQDLSEVLFIATANDVQGIPRPLLDRMELMEIPGYTENEKEHIAREHLIPKQMEINGIPEGKLVIQPAALGKLINNYTKEAGVRSLERSIGRICRKTARAIMEEGKDKVVVTSRNISRFLGKERYNYLMANEKDEIGIARGLAWTQVGGDTLQIEVNIMPGKGELLLTGQLGDVMKESAQAGISYIRSVSDQYEIDPEFFQKHDMHVHIPEGAVPKDGPSAGITMATAMLSAIIEKPVRADLAMTGEITLRGRVLPIGGLKEKTLAARMAHMKKVLVPDKNRPDMAEISKEITKGMEIVFVKTMDDVVREAFV